MEIKPLAAQGVQVHELRRLEVADPQVHWTQNENICRCQLLGNCVCHMERLKRDFTGDRKMAKTLKFCCNLIRFV